MKKRYRYFFTNRYTRISYGGTSTSNFDRDISLLNTYTCISISKIEKSLFLISLFKYIYVKKALIHLRYSHVYLYHIPLRVLCGNVGLEFLPYRELTATKLGLNVFLRVLTHVIYMYHIKQVPVGGMGVKCRTLRFLPYKI